MNFLQPALLAALPLAAVPLVIHLIHQRRYQTMPWAAMMFLLAAQERSRGYARIRRWLILLFRTLVIFALIFAVSRPLASGWLGAASGGSADTVILLLDRSPSMQQRDPATMVSKLATGRQQWMRTLRTLDASRWVLIESAARAPREIDSLDVLDDLPDAGPVDASADIPAMLRAAHDYIVAHPSGSVDVWIVSDLRTGDWNPDSGRWQSLRQAFDPLPQQVRFHLLAYPQPAMDNLSVRVTQVRRQQQGDDAVLLVSLRLERPAGASQPMQVPIRLEIQSAGSEFTVPMAGSVLEWTDHPIPLDPAMQRGWGRVAIPADTNAADNEFYFAFDTPPPRHAVIVAEDPLAAQPLQLAASIAPDRHTECTSEIVPASALHAVPWQRVALLLWQGDLPDDRQAEPVERFVAAGGQVIFFPPRSSSGRRRFGVGWGDWQRGARNVSVDAWRGDQDLLAGTLSGTALPVGHLQVDRYAALIGSTTTLASLTGGRPLLARAATPQGGVYFCTTTPRPTDSSLATDGVVLYVAIQRAMQRGAAALANTRQQDAGAQAAEDASRWKRLAGPQDVLSSEYPFHRGLYAADQRLQAINRSAAEDQTSVVADDRLAELFGALPLIRIDDRAGNANPLVQEIWRLFLVAMMVSMIVEAALSLPRRRPAAGSRR